MKNFDPKYNNIPKTEIHIHLEGAIRTQTIIDVAKASNLKLPAYEAGELDKYVKVYDQMQSLEAVLKAFDIFQNSITSPEVVERIAWELFEDSAKQNIKLFEVRFSPDWAFHGHNLDWDACLEGLLRAKATRRKRIRYGDRLYRHYFPQHGTLTRVSKRWIGRFAYKQHIQGC